MLDFDDIGRAQGRQPGPKPGKGAVVYHSSGHFSEKELVDLTWAIATINAWNRVAISLRSEPGKYKPVAHTGAQMPKQPVGSA